MNTVPYRGDDLQRKVTQRTVCLCVHIIVLSGYFEHGLVVLLTEEAVNMVKDEI